MHTRQTPALDRLRLAAAVLVVAIHTDPLGSFAPDANWWLTRVLARLAVPCFAMLTGHFLARSQWWGLGRFCRRTALLYGAAVALYLPLNLYAGAWPDLRDLLLDGTFYHLWYFPAILLAAGLGRLLDRAGRAGLWLAGALYLAGLGGDSWYGLAVHLPGMGAFYAGVSCLWQYTRNGLFFLPLFVLLGARMQQAPPSRRCAGLALAALGGMTLEAALLRGLDAVRHDSMYLLLPLAAAGAFGWALGQNAGRDRQARRLSVLVYLLHPWCIVLLRGVARFFGCRALLVDNSAVHFGGVLALSVVLGVGADKALAALRTELPARTLPPHARAWREVDLGALRHNVRALRGALPAGCTLTAVVKADAYGHGAVAVARCLWGQGVRDFAVACPAEGMALRRAGIGGQILVLGWTDPACAPLLRRWRLTAAVTGLDHAKALSAAGVPLTVQLAVDTGMHRLGIPASDTDALVAVFALPHLKVTGVFSHLCTSDGRSEPDRAFAQAQCRRFAHALAVLRARSLDPGQTHLQASYGVLNPACTGGQVFDTARVGIALYGVYSDAAPVDRPPDLRPVLCLRARVAAVQSLAPGEGAGYGLAFVARRPTRLAVLAIGYADGIPRNFGETGGVVLLHGVRCPAVGRVCMDQMLVDATDLPGALGAGDRATLIGTDGGQTLSAEEVAGRCGTITNELLARLSPRLGLVVRDA